MVLKSFSGIRFSGLILFFLLACSGARESKEPATISIQWRDSKAVALNIPKQLLAGIPDDSINSHLSVHLKQSKDAPRVLGEYIMENDTIRFRPLIPLTRNLQYQVRLKNIPLQDI